MGRKCSHCGNIGHNSRTCTTSTYSYTTTTAHHKASAAGHGLRLFGVQLTDMMTSSNSSHLMKKSFSMDCLSINNKNSSDDDDDKKLSRIIPSIDEMCVLKWASSSSSSVDLLSPDVLLHHDRRKGVAWTEEEHMMFLLGLEKLGKGDWRGISKKYVTTRTPTQIASHAQKYFLRIATLDKKKRRSSLFDMTGRSHFMYNSRPNYNHHHSEVMSSYKQQRHHQNASSSSTSTSLPHFGIGLNSSSDAHQQPFSASYRNQSQQQCERASGGSTLPDLELSIGDRFKTPSNYGSSSNAAAATGLNNNSTAGSIRVV